MEPLNYIKELDHEISQAHRTSDPLWLSALYASRVRAGAAFSQIGHMFGVFGLGNGAMVIPDRRRGKIVSSRWVAQRWSD